MSRLERSRAGDITGPKSVVHEKKKQISPGGELGFYSASRLLFLNSFFPILRSYHRSLMPRAFSSIPWPPPTTRISVFHGPLSRSRLAGAVVCTWVFLLEFRDVAALQGGRPNCTQDRVRKELEPGIRRCTGNPSFSTRRSNASLAPKYNLGRPRHPPLPQKWAALIFAYTTSRFPPSKGIFLCWDDP